MIALRLTKSLRTKNPRLSGLRARWCSPDRQAGFNCCHRGARMFTLPALNRVGIRAVPEWSEDQALLPSRLASLSLAVVQTAVLHVT